MIASLKPNESFKDQFIVFILLFFSGSPLFFSGSPLLDLAGKFGYLFGIIIFVILVRGQILNGKLFYRRLILVLIVTTIIFLLQFIEFDFTSVLGDLNFDVKIILGALVINHFGYKFPDVLFKLMTSLCFISLIGFILFNLLKLPISGIPVQEQSSFIIFGTTTSHPTRNEGMFWEPGAFAGIITLTLALNFSNLGLIWKRNPFSIIVVALALISTQSTTGYLVGFIIFAGSFFVKAGPVIGFIFLPLIFAASAFVYTSTDFLDEKINTQYKEAMDANRSEKIKFSNTRFGSFLFNLHYIKKEPIFGNGLHEKTRYADHPILIHMVERGENLGDGNGFANIVACMGVPFVAAYFTLIFLTVKKIDGAISALWLLLVVFFDLQAEQWLFYPIFLGLPFLFLGVGKTYRVIKIQ